MRVLLVDNYDSFTWNLVHYLRSLGAEVDVRRNDAVSGGEAASGWDAVVISPGPGTPNDAGVSLDVVAACAAARVPLLGVCLGHQAIGQYFGGRVVRAREVMHGKTSDVAHDGVGVFATLPSPLVAARYHSLVVADHDVPACLAIHARAPDGTIMGLAHRTLPMHGVQFHPESVASTHGHALLGNFLCIAESYLVQRRLTGRRPVA